MSKERFSAYLQRKIGHSRNVKTKLAQALEVHGSNVTKYLKGVTLPSVDKTIKIAGYFGDDPDEVLRLAGYEAYADYRGDKSTEWVPIIGYVAGGPVELEYEFDDSGFPPGASDEYLEVEGAKVSENDYGLRLKGDSLSPAYPEDTLLLVSPLKSFIPNHLCVVRAVDGRCWLKFVSLSNNIYTFASINPSYPPFSLHKDEVRWIHPIKWIKFP
jgi:SOS-response transcriptional repressor LexA